jgi:hypothetical protein
MCSICTGNVQREKSRNKIGWEIDPKERRENELVMGNTIKKAHISSLHQLYRNYRKIKKF